ncbi:MAG: hypothetical protein ACLP7P_17755 [Rhodomicrobium sp.]
MTAFGDSLSDNGNFARDPPRILTIAPFLPGYYHGENGHLLAAAAKTTKIDAAAKPLRSLLGV